MIKQDIVDNVANATGLTKVEVEAVLNESFGEIIRALSNNEKKPRSGLLLGSIEKATIPEKPIKKTIGIIIKKEMIKLFFKV